MVGTWVSFAEIVVSAVAVEAYSAHRSVQRMTRNEAEGTDGGEEDGDGSVPSVVLDRRAAIALPIVSSCMLVLLFFFYRAVSFVVAISVLLSASQAISFILAPYLRSLWPSQPSVRLPCDCGSVSAARVILSVASLGLLIWWLASGSTALNNVFGAALCVMFISLVVVPDVRVACGLLIALFFYDVFWVNYSAPIFGRSVMEHVATESAVNPVHEVARGLGLPAPKRLFVPTLQLPVKLIFHGSMLGLGDIALPGVLLSYLARYDRRRGTGFWKGYFAVGLVGYALGLIQAMCAARVMRRGQPALMFIVPSIILPLLAVSAWKGETAALLWSSSRAVSGASTAGTHRNDDDDDEAI